MREMCSWAIRAEDPTKNTCATHSDSEDQTRLAFRFNSLLAANVFTRTRTAKTLIPRARSRTHSGKSWWVIFCCCSLRICVLCELLLPRAMCMRNYGVDADGMRRKGVRHMRRTSAIGLHRCSCCVALTAKQVGSSDPQNYLVLLRDFQFSELVRLPKRTELYCDIIVFSTRTWFRVHLIVFYEMLCLHHSKWFKLCVACAFSISQFWNLIGQKSIAHRFEAN